MTASGTCLDEHDLTQLLRGLVSDEVAGPLEQHLLGCNSCLQKARQATLTDTLTHIGPTPDQVLGADWQNAADALLQRFGKIGNDGTKPTERYDFLEPTDATDQLGTFGRYRVLRELGRGGMGIVFQGTDPVLGRDVAIKVMRPDLVADTDARQRFLREARAIAGLTHDHIVAVHEADEVNGVPYFTMPLLRGETLDARLDRDRAFFIAEGLRLAREIALGLSAAHERGLIHRDIKPANIWLEEPHARVKILDFGLVHNVDGSGLRLTHRGMLLGSPGYFSPEQIEGAAVEPASDLFSLGCVLYRVFTGQVPFEGRDVRTLLNAAVKQEPVPPVHLDRQIPARLSKLVMRLLAKNAASRPVSAASVVNELEAIEQSHASTVTTPTAPARSSQNRWRWLLRGVPAILLVSVGAFLTLAPIAAPLKPGPTTLSPENIDIYERSVAGDGSASRAPAGLVGILGSSILSSWAPGHCVAFSTDGKWIASGGSDGRVTLWDSTNGHLARVLCPTRNQAHVAAIAFSPDGKRLVAGIGCDLWVWDSSNGQLLFDVFIDTYVRGIAFSSDSRLLATGHTDGRVFLWSLAETKEEIAAKVPLTTRKQPVAAVAFSPNGQHLAIGTSRDNHLQNPGQSEQVVIVRSATGVIETALEQSDQASLGVCYSPNGKWLAAGGGGNGIVTVWDAATGKLLRSIKGHTNTVKSLCFSPDSKLLASASFDRTVSLWDVPTLTPHITYAGHRGFVTGVAFSPDGHTVASTDLDSGCVRLWDAASGKTMLPATPSIGMVTAVAQSPDGRLIACGGDVIQIWDVSGPAPALRHTLDGHKLRIDGLAFSPDGKSLASASEDGSFRLWDVASGRSTIDKPTHNGQVRCIAYSADGRLLATGHVLNVPVMLWDAHTAEHVASLSGHDSTVREVAFSPVGGILASASDDSTIRLWDIAERKQRGILKGHNREVMALAFTPDGKHLISGSLDKTVKIWNVADGTLAPTRIESTADVWAVAISQDGQALAYAGADGRVWLRNLQGAHLGVIPLNPYPLGFAHVRRLRFTPDGRHLLTGNGNGTAYVLRRPDLGE